MYFAKHSEFHPNTHCPYIKNYVHEILTSSWRPEQGLKIDLWPQITLIEVAFTFFCCNQNGMKSILWTFEKPQKCYCSRIWTVCFKPSVVKSRTSRSIILQDTMVASDVIKVFYSGEHRKKHQCHIEKAWLSFALIFWFVVTFYGSYLSCQNWPKLNPRPGRPKKTPPSKNLNLSETPKSRQ